MRPAVGRSLLLKKLATSLFTAFILMVAGEVARAEQDGLYPQVMRCHRLGAHPPGESRNAQIETLLVITRKTFDNGDSGGPGFNERGELEGVITGVTEKNNILIDVSEVKIFLEAVNCRERPR